MRIIYRRGRSGRKRLDRLTIWQRQLPSNHPDGSLIISSTRCVTRFLANKDVNDIIVACRRRRRIGKLYASLTNNVFTWLIPGGLSTMWFHYRKSTIDRFCNHMIYVQLESKFFCFLAFAVTRSVAQTHETRELCNVPNFADSEKRLRADKVYFKTKLMIYENCQHT